MHLGLQHQTGGIGQHLSLAAVDLLEAVSVTASRDSITTHAAPIGRLDALAVHHPSFARVPGARGRWIAARLHAAALAQRRMEAFPRSQAVTQMPSLSHLRNQA